MATNCGMTVNEAWALIEKGEAGLAETELVARYIVQSQVVLGTSMEVLTNALRYLDGALDNMPKCDWAGARECDPTDFDSSTTVQAVVYENVTRQGNTVRRNGTPWTPDEFAARQILVVLSASIEALWQVVFPPTSDMSVLRGHLLDVKRMADFIQRFENLCVGAVIADRIKFSNGLAAIAIPTDCAFEALGEDATNRKLVKSGLDALDAGG